MVQGILLGTENMQEKHFWTACLLVIKIKAIGEKRSSLEWSQEILPAPKSWKTDNVLKENKKKPAVDADTL